VLGRRKEKEGEKKKAMITWSISSPLYRAVGPEKSSAMGKEKSIGEATIFTDD
jgi:hypothetical protein